MAVCDCCGLTYERTRRTQRFCSAKCRQSFHNACKPMAGPAGSLTMVRKVKTGAISVTVHFMDDDARRALDFSIGDIVLVAEVPADVEST